MPDNISTVLAGLSDFTYNSITGCHYDQFIPFFFSQNNPTSLVNNVFVLPNTEDAEAFYSTIKHISKTYFYPDFGSEPYSSMLSSEYNFNERFRILQDITSGVPCNIVTTQSALRILTPSSDFFKRMNFKIEVDQIILPDELALNLTKLGYSYAHSVEERGSFARKGEIFDIHPINSFPVRINYFDELIESIYRIDSETLMTIKDAPVQALNLGAAPYTLFHEDFKSVFISKFPRISHTDREKYLFKQGLLKSLNNNQIFDDFPLYLGYFFENNFSLLDFLQKFKIYTFEQSISSKNNFFKEIYKQYEDYAKTDDIGLKPHFSDLYSFSENIFKNDILVSLDSAISDKSLELNITPLTGLLSSINPTYLSSNETKIQTLVQLINKSLLYKDIINIYYTSASSREEISFLLSNSSSINFIKLELSSGFRVDNFSTLYISEFDFFGKKSKKHKNKNKLLESDLFAEQLSTLVIGDFVVHKDHGVGKYLGIETLTLGNSTSDYILLSYQDDDKVYVPVYKMSLLQKHASSESTVSVSNLKNTKFEQIKSRARSSVKKLAFDLLKLNAKRMLLKGHEFSHPDHLYKEFSLAFKFQETEDQLSAIDDIISDLTSPRPMDRLVCGDVGFGKTEVAMRAAFIAVSDSKQVSVLVPTTVLAFQHYNSFCERFKGFPIRIEFLSRFKTPKEARAIIEDLNLGKIDIIIGTHKLLGDSIKFKDLGLIIIDEEQRFGVAHKEKLKLFRETIDTLVLTATPIPRTLHQSFLGIKELSLIKTAPLRRQSIKTHVIKEDKNTLKMALEKELNRGGQIFVVHNRVNDIENYTAKIRNLVPQARIVFAHGQMPERTLEKIIADFYNYKYDILVSTTIIESGIDIPRANTMIVDRADTYGLSQLHQLRGRIGRSERKAYAYFVIPSDRNLSEVSAKRLRALQTYADLGSGFSLASSDLEIRGTGDVLGPEQSGHINTIGLELYTELLQEAIAEIKGESLDKNEIIEISTPFDCYIPDKFISEPGIRLKFYKQLSNNKNIENLDQNFNQIIDQYGPAPSELKNLYSVIKAKIFLKNIGLSSIKVKSKSIVLTFNPDFLNKNIAIRDKVLGFFTLRPKIYKLNPDYSIICNFKDTISIETFLDFSVHIAKELNI